MQSKFSLREKMRARRAALSDQEQLIAADRLARQIAALPLFRNSRRIAFYYPNDGEIDPTLLLGQARRVKKDCYLPVLSHLNGYRLRFAPIEPGIPLVDNRYGIPEPITSKKDCRSAINLDLVLLPLVAFDKNGNRIGMGGGYYDRTLGFLRHRRYWRKPRLLGVAHDFQRVDRLEVSPWDVPMDGIVTDAAYYPVTR